MEISIKFNTVKSGCPGSNVIYSANVVVLPQKIDFVLANSAGPDEMSRISSVYSLFTKIST